MSNKVMNLAMKAYITSGNQKTVLAVRQSQDLFLDKFKELSSPKTILELDRETMKNFYKKRMIKK